eukprot:2096858-Pleurochrysis_carterae.AAC.1
MPHLELSRYDFANLGANRKMEALVVDRLEEFSRIPVDLVDLAVKIKKVEPELWQDDGCAGERRLGAEGEEGARARADGDGSHVAACTVYGTEAAVVLCERRDLEVERRAVGERRRACEEHPIGLAHVHVEVTQVVFARREPRLGERERDEIWVHVLTF